MNLFKKWITIALASVLMVSMVGCSIATTSSQTNDKDSLLAAKEKLTGAKNYHGILKIDLEMGDDTGQSSNVITTTDLMLFTSPLLAKIDTVSTDGKDANPQARVYLEEKDGEFMSYMENAGTWQKQVMDKSFIDFALSQYDPKICLDAYIKASYDVKKLEKEKIGDMDAQKYEAVIPGASLQTVFYQTGIFSFIGLGNLPGEYFVNLPDVKIEYWIGSDGYPVQYRLDVTEVLQRFFDQAREGMVSGGPVAEKVTVSKYVIESTCDQIDQVETFEIPAEAKEAKDLSQSGSDMISPEDIIPESTDSEDTAPTAPAQ